MKLSGREKATIFLSILGSDTSEAILKYLPEDLADLIASSVNNLPTPTPEALGAIFSDFKSYVALPQPAKAEDPMHETPLNNVLNINSLDDANSKKLAFLLSEEKPQIAAFILSILPLMKREEVLMNITVGRDQIDDLLQNIRNTPMTSKIKERLVKHFLEKV